MIVNPRIGLWIIVYEVRYALLLMILWDFVVVILFKVFHKEWMEQPSLPVSLIGSALALFMGFRDFLNTYRIDLPNKEGYQVVGREGELGATDQTVYLKYGKPFSFRVDIDPAYDKSPYQVYIVSGYGWTNMDTSTILQDLEPAQPDSNGYYNIPSVESDYTVFVMGVIENATVEKVGGIFEQVKSIFEMIRKFFAQFLALFGINM